MKYFFSFVTYPLILFLIEPQINFTNKVSMIDAEKINISSVNESKKDSSKLTLSFSNYTWYIKSGDASPGPNCWSANNAFVDSIGRLHLKITFNQGTQKWDCAEIWTTDSLGFGTYEWLIDGPIDKLDKNIVLGLFNYPASPKVPDATNEIDIEYAKWGLESKKAGNFTVWPATLLNGFTNQTFPFKISLSNTKTLQRFIWSSTSVVFQSFRGWEPNKDSVVSSQTFSPKNPTLFIPQTAEPVHLNLWLFRGLAPSDNSPVEIIIHKFQKYE